MKYFVITFLLLIISLFSNENIRVEPFPNVFPNENIRINIIFPRPEKNTRQNPVNVQVQISGFEIGRKTDDIGSNDLHHYKEGQTLRLVIDNQPYITFNPLMYGFPTDRHYIRNQVIQFKIPFSINPGKHVLRVFPVTSYGVSIKSYKAVSSEIFYFQDYYKYSSVNIDLNKPYLTYNEPQGIYPDNKNHPILLDFLLTNCELRSNGFKVLLTIDKSFTQLLNTYNPYLIWGLSEGKHTIKLELLNKENTVSKGYFNCIEREIEINSNFLDKRKS